MGFEAVIEAGGRQYPVAVGDVIQIPHVPGAIGDNIKIDRVLMLRRGDQPQVGRPHLGGVSVAAEILSQDKDDKVLVFRFRRRTKYRRKTGHRQPQTQVRITAINA